MSLVKSPDLKIENYLAIVILFLSSCAVVWGAAPIWQNQNLNDDSFITLTYAKNLAAGKGFIYNHPPATLGTTTPLFTFLSALLALLLPFFTVIETAIVLSVISWISTAWVLYLIMRHINFRPLPAALAASVPLLIMQEWVGFIGMEIWLFQFLLVLSIYFSLKHSLLYAGLCVGALFLTRGEGALVGVILFGYLWVKHRQAPVQFALAVTSVVVVVWITYALLTFGTVIPNTLAVKQIQAQLPFGRNFIDRIMLELLPNYIGGFRFLDLWILNPYLILVGLGLVYTVYRHRVLLIFIGRGIAYLAGYTVLNPSPYYWYMLHIVFILQMMAGVGLAGSFAPITSNSPRPLRALTGLIATILTISFLYFGIGFIFWLPNFSGDQRGPTYRAVSTWLRDNTSAEESVAFIEIGYLGYFTENRIIDLAGLTDPLITAHVLGDGFSWGFWHYQPDYYIYADEFEWALGNIKPPLESYTLVHQIERDTLPTPIYIFKRDGD